VFKLAGLFGSGSFLNDDVKDSKRNGNGGAIVHYVHRGFCRRDEH
jgi:hypothetical protein